MQLTKLAEAIKTLGRPRYGFSLLIYGPPKVGKTHLAATIAKVPQIKRVFLFDLENGHETLLTMLRTKQLTQEEGEKINVIAVQDTASRPLAMETVLRCFTVTQKVHTVCEEHGKINCAECATPDKKPTGTEFKMSDLTHDDVVILDSASALSASILNFYCRTEDPEKPKKAGWDEYGNQGRDLTNILLTIQACKTNFIVITHEYVTEGVSTVLNKRTGEIDTITWEEKYPLIGTRNFAINCAKFFSHVIYMSIELQKHKAGSSSTYKDRVISGSRGGWQIERAPVLSLVNIFNELYKPEETVS